MNSPLNRILFFICACIIACPYGFVVWSIYDYSMFLNNAIPHEGIIRTVAQFRSTKYEYLGLNYLMVESSLSSPSSVTRVNTYSDDNYKVGDRVTFFENSAYAIPRIYGRNVILSYKVPFIFAFVSSILILWFFLKKRRKKSVVDEFA